MESVTLTYEELAERLGIAVDSARIKARRRKWPVSPGNDGRARVTVPLEALESAHGERSGDVRGALEERIALLSEQLLEARVAHAKAEGEAAAQRELVAELKAMLAELRQELAEARKPWWRRWRS